LEYIRHEKFANLTVDVSIFLRETHGDLVHIVSGVGILGFPLDLDGIVFGDFPLYDTHLTHYITCIVVSFLERYEIRIGIKSATTQILHYLSIDAPIGDIDDLACTTLDSGMIECDLFDDPLVYRPLGSCETDLITDVERLGQ
jgi:hypothetical protein